MTIDEFARTAAIFVGVIGLMALLLTTAGYYGVVFYSVSRRTREIAIRAALGAQRSKILSMIMGYGMRLTGAGIAIGLVGAMVLAQIMGRALFGISPLDPLTFALTTLLLIGITLLACYIPARRATRIDPMVALREE